MILLIDASVAAKSFLQEDLRDNARALVSNHLDHIVPDRIIQEAAYAIFKRWHSGDIIDSQPKTITEVSPKYFSSLLPTVDMATWAFAIALEMNYPVYGYLYLPYAELLPVAFPTNKQHLYQAVQNTPYQALVRRLDDPGLPEALEP